MRHIEMSIGLCFLFVCCMFQGCSTLEHGRCTSFYGKPYIKTELYFGRNRSDSTIVSDVEWRGFLDSIVTPRFREGLTVMDAQGQWLEDQTKQVVREPSKVLILLYEEKAEDEHSIEFIRERYKQLFRQESVLRITTCVGASF